MLRWGPLRFKQAGAPNASRSLPAEVDGAPARDGCRALRPSGKSGGAPELTAMLAGLAMSVMTGFRGAPDELAADAAPSRWERLERVGEGASAIVWRARHAGDGRLVALKVARGDAASLAAVAREGTLLARVARRWGPALVEAGEGYVATEWVAGAPLDVVALKATDREKIAAIIAHAAGRALDELHEAGVRHGDVKPANLVRSKHAPVKDAADDRGATLIDLGLAADVADRGDALGGTPRYAAPELAARGEATPAADLWSLGIVLAEILDAHVATAVDARAAVASWPATMAAGEPARWVRALLSDAPGGRPSAGWIADRAARWLGLRADTAEAEQRRLARVRRTYLAARADELAPGAEIASSVGEPARAWLEATTSAAGPTGASMPASGP